MPGRQRRISANSPGYSAPWADERHLAAQHVDELRQLVELRPREHAADAREALVVDERQPRPGGVAPHLAELDHVELAAIATDPARAIEHRARLVDDDGDGDRDPDRQREHEQDAGEDDVEDPGEHGRARLVQAWIDHEQGHAVDTAHARALTELLEQTRHDSDGETERAAARGDIGEPLVARARVGECDRVDSVLPGDLLELVERAEHALAARVVEATDDHRAGLAEGPRQRIRHGSAARDQHPVDRRVEPAEARNQERCGAGNGHGQQRVHRGQAVARDILDEREAQGEPRERGGRAMSAGPGCERDGR